MDNGNQIKMAQFISELRKEKKLTQKELAEQLGVTDKAVSKWERGLGCPDISLLVKLSTILGITTTELLNGEKRDIANPELDAVVETTLDYAEVATKDKIIEGTRWKYISIISGVALLLLFLMGAATMIDIKPNTPILLLPIGLITIVGVLAVAITYIFNKHIATTAVICGMAMCGTIHYYSTLPEPTAELVRILALFPKGYLPHYTVVFAAMLITVGLLLLLVITIKRPLTQKQCISIGIVGFSLVIISILTIGAIMDYTDFYVPGVGVDPRVTITLLLMPVLNCATLAVLARRMLGQRTKNNAVL